MLDMEREMFKKFVILSLCLNSSTGNRSYENGDIKVYKFAEKHENEIAAMKNEIDFLKQRVTRLEANFDGPRKGLLTADMTASTKDNSHAVKKRAITRRIRRPEVAFQASLTKVSETVKLYDKIIFNNVITNIGHAYNKHTGVFTTPIAGTYAFNTNIVSGKGHYVEASIQVNDRVTVSAISDHRLSGDNQYFTTWDQGNAVAILRLKRGDKVSVSVQWPQGSHVIHGVGKSSFSGYLLRSHERH